MRRLIICATGAPDMSPPKPSPGIISRNIGKIVLLTLSSLIAYLYRSSENQKRSKALKVYLEDQRSIEPWEIDEFRMANWGTWDRALFQEVANELYMAFPGRKTASYPAFIRVVAHTLGRHQKRLQLGHYLDRVVLCLEPEEGKEVDVLTFLCALSLSLNFDVEERIGALHDAVTAADCGHAGSSSAGKGEEGARKIHRRELEQLVAGLVATAQIPAEALVKADPERSYPFQAYQVASIEELVTKASTEGKAKHEKAMKDAVKAGLEPPKPPSLGTEQEDKGAGEGLSARELIDVLSTKAICVWGECYQGRD
ncbi:hypothetical protein NSK_006888 [Nannochloropsis salina CCMP1776]|uniref:Uncharacterized protein n=1 Tax=Nannochloropsis salina CCMP1776 TaxID=1027361 RepID=A0A4D9CU89_9STRA|nr:hypothetical protein NSK_006888 [Nannochloropsis salina CCMP1776]|eukprot:TFJ81637.1 hypothetical protein NSK_006888 [Nannochloropsis salina CCMP1776]